MPVTGLSPSLRNVFLNISNGSSVVVYYHYSLSAFRLSSTTLFAFFEIYNHEAIFWERVVPRLRLSDFILDAVLCVCSPCPFDV